MELINYCDLLVCIMSNKLIGIAVVAAKAKAGRWPVIEEVEGPHAPGHIRVWRAKHEISH